MISPQLLRESDNNPRRVDRPRKSVKRAEFAIENRLL